MALISNGESGLSVRTKLNASLLFTQAITATAAEINYLAGASANVASFLGAADYAAMRTQLGLVIGTNVQAYNANLTSFATVAPSANGLSFVSAANYAAMKTLLNLSGTNTGDQTITLTGNVTGSGTGSFATTIANGVVTIAMLSATGTPSASTFLRGDGTWAVPSGGGGGDLLAANNLSDLVSKPTSRTNLGVAIGSDVQAYNANLTTIGTSTTGDLIYASGTNTLAKLAAGTDTYVLTMAGGVPTWAAPGAGSSALSSITAMTGNASINNDGYTLTWGWNSSTTTDPFTISSSSLTTGRLLTLTNTSNTVTSGGLLDIVLTSSAATTGIFGIRSTITGLNSTTNQATYAGYFENTKTHGTSSRNYAIFATTNGSSGVADAAIKASGHAGGTVYIGNKDASTGQIWFGTNSVTISTSNWSLQGDSTSTSMNAATTVSLQVGGANRVRAESAGVHIGANAVPVSAVCSLIAPTASRNIGLVSLGSGTWAGANSGFGKNSGGTNTSNASGTALAMNLASGYAGDMYNLQIAGTMITQCDASGNISAIGSLTTGAPSGGTATAIKFGEIASVTPTAQNRTVRVEIGGAVIYLTGKTTND